MKLLLWGALLTIAIPASALTPAVIGHEYRQDDLPALAASATARGILQPGEPGSLPDPSLAFGTPQSGVMSAQLNSPRQIQIALKLVF